MHETEKTDERTLAQAGAALAVGTLMAAAAVALAVRKRTAKHTVRGRVVLVTGSSRGLGLALAEQFARAGARVVLTARSEDTLARARGLLIARGAAAPDQVLAVACDIREKVQVDALFEAIAEEWSPVEILVNNAGIIQVGPVESQSVSSFEDAMRSNYYGMMYCSLAALPAMLERGDGAIVNIASIGGKVAVPHLLPYSASKFAMVGFSQGLGAEVRAKGVRVTTVTPGLLRTGSPRNALFTGDREREFRWFNLGASLPGISRNAYAAAGRILRATENGEIELSITLQAAVAARVAGFAPVLTNRVLSLVNRLALPKPRVWARKQLPGSASQGKDLRALTAAGHEAERTWNER